MPRYSLSIFWCRFAIVAILPNKIQPREQSGGGEKRRTVGKIYDGNPLNVNSNDNGVNVDRNWNPENANDNIAASVQVISRQAKASSQMLLLT